MSERRARFLFTPRQWVAIVLTIAAFAASWWWIIPPQLGGRTTFLTTSGVSMEPLMHDGDLAVLRKQSTYHVGDVIAYRSETLRAVVLHRVVKIDPNGITTQGDNNSWTDVDRPTPGQIIGRMDRRFIDGGKYLEWLSLLPVRIILAALVGILLYAALRPARARRTEVAIESAGSFDAIDEHLRSQLEAHLVATDSAHSKPPASERFRHRLRQFATVFLVAFVLLGVIAFVQPVREKGGMTLYSHKGAFSYQGAVGDGGDVVYGRNTAETGDVLYLNLVHEINTTFTYAFDSISSHRAHGTLSAELVVEGRSGWKRTFPLNASTPYFDNRGTVSATINLDDITSLINTINARTGIKDTNYTVSMFVYVDTTAEVSGARLTERFQSQLLFNGDDRTLRPAKDADSEASSKPNGDKPELEVRSQGVNTAKGGTINTPYGPLRALALFGNSITIESLRTFAAIGLLVALALFVASFSLWWNWANRQRERVRELRELRHELQRKSRLNRNTAHDVEQNSGKARRDKTGPSARNHVVDVNTFGELLDIAEHFSLPLSRARTQRGQFLYVKHDNVIYRYIKAERSGSNRFERGATPNEQPARNDPPRPTPSKRKRPNRD